MHVYIAKLAIARYPTPSSLISFRSTWKCLRIYCRPYRVYTTNSDVLSEGIGLEFQQLLPTTLSRGITTLWTNRTSYVRDARAALYWQSGTYPANILGSLRRCFVTSFFCFTPTSIPWNVKYRSLKLWRFRDNRHFNSLRVESEDNVTGIGRFTVHFIEAVRVRSVWFFVSYVCTHEGAHVFERCPIF